MRILLAALMLIASLSGPVWGTTPAPLFSSVSVNSAPTHPCHWVFFPSNTFDAVVIVASLNDQSGLPCANTNVTASFGAVSGNISVCPAQASFTKQTGPLGLATFTFDGIYGVGTFLIDVWSDSTFINSAGPFTATSPDLTGNAVVDIFDLGAWASSLPPAVPDPNHDYTCDGCVDVFDLAVWAGGLVGGC